MAFYMKKYILLLLPVLLTFSCQNSEDKSSQKNLNHELVKINSGDISSKKAGETIKELYSLISDKDIHIVKVLEVGYYYRVTFETISNGKTVQKTVFLTRDGQYLTEEVTEINEKYNELTNQKRFANCLLDKGVRVLVHPENAESQKMIIPLGRFADKIIINCATSMENCANLGAQSLPAVLYKEKVYNGLKSREWLETLTGCK